MPSLSVVHTPPSKRRTCHGQIKVAETEEELAEGHARVAELRALGFSHEEVVDQAELRRLNPEATPSQN